MSNLLEKARAGRERALANRSGTGPSRSQEILAEGLISIPRRHEMGTFHSARARRDANMFLQ